jgi:alkanesulfonate monooxygenase SsuD/methylene tetrahydromethanopterin reductase-like flavin-dependent oxidoreductase (luciferase family)
MSRINIVLPRAAETRPPQPLPDFITDLRPSAADPWRALATAADLAGLAGVLVPFDARGPESLVTAAGLLRATRHIDVLAGLRPWIATPQYTAKLSASLQRFSGGRFGWYFDADDAETTAFVATAEAFWQSPDGLPEVLSAHAFPRVSIAGTPASARLDLRGLAPRAVADAIEEHEHAGVSEFFLDVGEDPGEVYRLGEYVLPLLSPEQEPDHVR